MAEVNTPSLHADAPEFGPDERLAEIEQARRLGPDAALRLRAAPP
jgi:hypothetical protein